MFQIKVVEKITTHISFNNNFSEILAVCEIMWKSMVEPDMTDNVEKYGRARYER